MSDDNEHGSNAGAVRKPTLHRCGCGFRYAPEDLSAGVDFSAAPQLLDTAPEQQGGTASKGDVSDDQGDASVPSRTQ